MRMYDRRRGTNRLHWSLIAGLFIHLIAAVYFAGTIVNQVDSIALRVERIERLIDNRILDLPDLGPGIEPHRIPKGR